VCERVCELAMFENVLDLCACVREGSCDVGFGNALDNILNYGCAREKEREHTLLEHALQLCERVRMQYFRILYLCVWESECEHAISNSAMHLHMHHRRKSWDFV